MPGIVVFKRRWSAGSDDLVVPTILLIVFHVAWEIVLVVVMSVVDFEPADSCKVGIVSLKTYVLVYLIMLAVAILNELIVILVSMQGSILKTGPRSSMQYLLYFKLVVLLFEFSWQVVGMIWLFKHYSLCPTEVPKKVTLSIIIFNWIIMLVIVISIWCIYDYAGGKWVKMKRYQDSMNERKQKRHSRRRNWRQRKALRAYEQSWDRRFNMLCCCVDRENNNRNSIAEIAKLFTEFFRDLDVVPSDVIAGFVLLRRHQSIRMRHIMSQGNNDVYQYISGVPITPSTSFLQLAQPEILESYHRVLHYMRFALAAYGWPAYMLINTSTGLCKMLPSLRCCCCKSDIAGQLIDDNCCQCNFVALLKLSTLRESDIVYVTYHVDIGETPFYVALDHKYRKVVICVRGTNSLQDVLTDLKADAEVLPLEPINEEWVGHKGMVQAAVYIRDKLKEDMILAEAFSKDTEKGTHKYELVLVGHSLGAGTAAILAILLKQEYPNLHCYSFSPPGGLLSEACVNDTKSFITSVVLAKDIVPRIGLPQLEVLRTDLINVIKNSPESKWKIIIRALCCGNDDARNMKPDEVRLEMERDIRAHPSDSAIALSSHTPLYPPGKIIHIVRSHPQTEKKSLGCCKSEESVYQAIWADNKAFDEVLVSPTMITDHMPDNVMDALEKVLINVAPPKPNRTLTEAERKAFLEQPTPTSETALSTDKLVQQADSIEASVQNEQCALPTYVWENGGESVMAVDEDGNLIFTSSRNKPKLALDVNSKETVEAPLASPENLSEKSSLSGSGSQTSVPSSQRDSHRKSLQSPQILETIQQSPLDKNRPQNFPDFCDVNDEKKGESNEVELNKTQVNNNSIMTCAIVENPPKCNVQDLDSTGEEVNRQTDCSNLSSDEDFKISINSNDDNIEYNRNSPVDGNQSEYGNPNCYYTAAGIGYPHGSGAYHPPMKFSDSSDSVDGDNQPMKLLNPSPSHHNHHHQHLSKKLSDSEILSEQDKLLKCSQSESHLQNLSNKYTMHRSMEHGDIAHLQDSAQVFEAGGYIPVHDTNCSRRSHVSALSNMGELTEETKAESASPEGDSDRQMSSSHSDEIFDLPLQETDV